MEKFQNKYRIDSSRLAGYDYSQNGMYFVTICTQNKYDFFGKIINCEMILNEMGKIADDIWQEIPAHFPFVEIDMYQIMPNHLHGIIVIDKKIFNKTNVGLSTVRDLPTVETPNLGVSTTDVNNHNTQINEINHKLSESYVNKNEIPITKSKCGGHNPQWKPGTLGVIINQFKRKCTIDIRQKINKNFTWQPRFHDHIIKNEKSLFNIRDYIANNPAKWQFDRNNQNDLWM